MADVTTDLRATVASVFAPTGALDHLSQSQAASVTGKEFFPHLVEGSFHHGLIIVFGLAIAMSLVGAVASLVRGERYVHYEQATRDENEELVLVDAEGSGGLPYVEDVAVHETGGRR